MTKSLLDSAVRRKIVEHLSANHDRALTGSELAEIAGVHPSTARFHLDQLVAGQALSTRYERRGVGRPRKVYFVSDNPRPGAVEEHNHALRLLSGLLVDMLTPTEDRKRGGGKTPEEAGEQWAREHISTHPSHDAATTPGEWLSKVGGLTDVLHQWGYEPAISTGADRYKADVRLTHCPFRDMARANPTVVCGIHRGLMRGAMTQLGELTTDVNLLPFVEDDLCVAHLQRHVPSEPRTDLLNKRSIRDHKLDAARRRPGGHASKESPDDRDAD